MAGADRRFGPSQREDPIDRPGLVIDDANDTYVITADGVRHLLDGSGGGAGSIVAADLDLTSVMLDTIGAGTDIVTNNASTAKHGLLRKLDNNTAHFLNGAGAWTTPAGGTSPELGWHNVRDYGAPGDGSDQTAAIQAAFDAAHAEGLAAGTFGGSPAYFPPGVYNFTGLTWKDHPIIGAGPNAVHCYYTGAPGGTAIDHSAYGSHRMSGMQFRGGFPGIWILMGYVDMFQTFDHVFITSASIAGIKTGMVINFHLEHMRFTAEGGPSIWLNHNGGGLRSFSIDGFTFDSGTLGYDGFLRVTMNATTDSITAALRNGRLESANNKWNAGSALVKLDGTCGVSCIQTLFENVCTDLGTQSNLPDVFYKEPAVQNACFPPTTAISCNFSGLNKYMGGTYEFPGGTPITIPGLPANKQVDYFSYGRDSGGSQSTHRIQDLHVGLNPTISPVLALIGSTTTWNPPSIAAGASSSTTVTVTGAALGDVATASLSSDITSGMILTAVVSAADTVRVTLTNTTGAPVDLGSMTLKARVWKG